MERNRRIVVKRQNIYSLLQKYKLSGQVRSIRKISVEPEVYCITFGVKASSNMVLLICKKLQENGYYTSVSFAKRAIGEIPINSNHHVYRRSAFPPKIYAKVVAPPLPIDPTPFPPPAGDPPSKK